MGAVIQPIAFGTLHAHHRRIHLQGCVGFWTKQEGRDLRTVHGRGLMDGENNNKGVSSTETELTGGGRTGRDRQRKQHPEENKQNSA